MLDTGRETIRPKGETREQESSSGPHVFYPRLHGRDIAEKEFTSSAISPALFRRFQMDNLPSVRSGSFLGERRSPFRAMAQMRKEMDELFNNFMNDSWDLQVPSLSSSGLQPFFDVDEKDSHFLLRCDVPGMSKEDIKIESRDNQLHVSGERKQEHEERKGKRFESESFYGSFDRWMTLPQNVNADGIEARVQNGVLEIAIPKTAASKAKEIKIGEEKSGIFSKLLGHKQNKEQAA